MKLLKYHDSTSGNELVVVAQNVFAVAQGLNEITGKDETRIYGSSDDFLGVSESVQQVVNDLASA